MPSSLNSEGTSTPKRLILVVYSGLVSDNCVQVVHYLMDCAGEDAEPVAVN